VEEAARASAEGMHCVLARGLPGLVTDART
jgi:hypothetical protein